MYFLKQALAGMQRRLFTSFLMLLATVAILLSGATIVLWAHWLGGEQGNARAARQASVFVDSVDGTVVAGVLTKIRALPGVEEAKQIAVEEFLGYLRKKFPDIAEAMAGMAADAFPSMIEVTLPRETSSAERGATLETILTVPGVARVDNGAKQIAAAQESLSWLGRGGMGLGIGLWFVLVVVALGHYQSVLHKEALEIQLLKGFGADPLWICLPWVIEAAIYAAAGALTALAAIWWGQRYVADLFNQFFEMLGYESFALDAHLFVVSGVGMFVAAFLAQAIGGAIAALRGKLV